MIPSQKFLILKKSFGVKQYRISDTLYKEKIMDHPLINGIWTIGPSFTLVANTQNWSIDMVTGESELITGFSNEEILQLQGKFVLDFPVEEHNSANMAAVKLGMEYIASRPVQERNNIFVVYFYYARNKNGGLLTIQHQSIPLVFDGNHIPYIFCNIYSDISYLQPSNIPLGLVINRHFNESFQVDPGKAELIRFSDLFSKREKEIIRLLIRGRNSREIAESLFISHETVRTHRKNILRKTNLSKTGELVHYCLFNGGV